MPPNQAPTDLSLSSSNVNENVEAGTSIGTLSTADPDAGNTFTYSLVTGTGDADNAAFSIAGNQLRINASPDFEQKSSYSIRVRTTDQGGLFTEKVLNVTVNDLDETAENTAPTDLSLSGSSVNENAPVDFEVGTLSSTDADAGSSFTYTLVDGTGAADNSAFVIVGDRLRIQNSPDFEAKPNLSIRVRTTDQGGLSFEKALAITVNNVNEAPTDLSLSNTEVAENVPANTVIGSFSSVDPDSGNTFTYSLVAGTGATDNAAFTIANNQLRINTSPDFEAKPSYSIRVRTTDQNGLTFEKPLTIAVQDVSESFAQFVGTQTADGMQGALTRLQELFDRQLLQANLPIVGRMTGAIPNFLTALRDRIVPAIRGAGNLSADAMETLLNGQLGSQFPGVQVVRTNAGQGESNFEVTIAQSSRVTRVANDLGMAGLGLTLNNASGQGTLNSSLRLAFGTNQAQGFFIDSDRTQLTSNLDFNLGANFNASGRMGLFRVRATDTPNNATRTNANFSAKLNDIDAPGTANDGNRLTTAEIRANERNVALSTSSLTSDPNLGLRITTDMGAAAIPGINTTLSGDIPLLTYVNGALSGTPNTTFSFNNTELSLGSIANNLVLPVLRQIDRVIAPMRPVLDVLYSDLRPIGMGLLFDDRDNDGKVTLIDMASVTRPVGLGFIQSARRLSDLSRRASASSTSGLLMGDFRATNFNPFGAANSIQQAGITQTRSATRTDAQLNSINDSGASLIQDFRRMEGLRFHLLEDVSNPIRLLIGQPVNLFTYDLPELELAFTAEKRKNIPKTPFVIGVGGSISASADLAFGFDTFGLQRWANSNYDPNRISQVFDGFFASDRDRPDGTGADVEEFKLQAGLNISGGVGLALKPAVELFGGLVGGLTGGPAFDLKDPNNDGKVRADELTGIPLSFSSVSVGASIGAEVSGSLGPLSAKLLSVTFLEGNLFKYDARTNQVELLGLPARDLINLINDGINRIKRAGLDLAARGGRIALQATRQALGVVANVGSRAANAVVNEFRSMANVANRAVDRIVNVFDAGRAAQQKLRSGRPLSPRETAALGAFTVMNTVRAPIVEVRAAASQITRQATNAVRNTASAVSSGLRSLGRRLFNEEIADAVVFFDQNFNSLLDEGEAFTVSFEDGSLALTIDLDKVDTNGNGQLDDTEGQLVSIGGYGSYTGLLSQMKFVAPGDSFGINPVTTLVSQMMREGKTQSEAIALVNQALGLPADLDVGSFMPDLAIAEGDAALGAKFEAVISQVHIAIVQISQLLDGASSQLSMDQINQLVIQSVTQQIASGAPLNLANAADIQTLLTTAIANVEAADPSLNQERVSAIVSQVSQVIAESNQRISQAANGAPNEVLRQIGLVQQVALGEVTKDLAAVGAGKKTVGALVAENTGAGFNRLLTAVRKAQTGGTDLSDILRGTSRNDRLRGQAGDDLIYGDLGNDRLLGEADADKIRGDQGRDLLQGGVGNDDLSGGAGGDRLLGGEGNDLLVGDEGRDVLIGGAGRDRFSLGLSARDQDRIVDFSTRQDLLLVSGLSGVAGITTGRSLSAKFFRVGTKAGDRNDYFVYNQSTGDLFYDANGSAKGMQTKIAQFAPGVELAARHIVVA